MREFIVFDMSDIFSVEVRGRLLEKVESTTVPHLRNHTLVKKKKTAECYSGDSDEGVEQKKKATVHHITNSIVKEGIHRND